jgi:hypothetical protein
VCSHVSLWPMEDVDREVMATLCTDVLRPSIASEIIAKARERFEASRRPDDQAASRKQLATVERELERLSEAIALSDAPVRALVERMSRAEATRQQLVERLSVSRDTAQPVWSDLERRVSRNLSALRERFSGGIVEARAGLRALLTGPIMFTPCVVRGYQAIQFSGRLGLDGVFGGTVLVTRVASPTGFEPVFWP